MSSDILSGLNEFQKEAVTYQGSPLLILAGLVLVNSGFNSPRCLFCQRKFSQSSEILLLTFTKSRREMKQR